MSTTPICPCEGFEHPATITNPAGLTTVRYRIGDFLTFRRALLQSLPGEAALTLWRPRPEDDFVLQMLEWWAYIADVLTFYNEVGINRCLLSTAPLDADLRGLIRILGYRPRPGIGGSATVAALLSGTRPVFLPVGFRLQSKPAPGQQPQTFETTTPATLSLPDAISAAPPGLLAGPAGQIYLEGTVKNIGAGDILLLAPQGSFSGAVLILVQSVAPQKDAAGNPFTAIQPSGSPALPDADASGYRLLRSGHGLGLWKYPTTTGFPLATSPMDTASVDRSITAGQAIVLTAPGLASPQILNVIGTTETIWYTNGVEETPPAAPTPPASAPHTRIDWTPAGPFDLSPFNDNPSAVQVLLDWRPAGTLRNAPTSVYAGSPRTLLATAGSAFPAGSQQTVLLEDADGNGVQATVSVDVSTPGTLSIASFAATPSLKLPLRVLPNLLTLTRGKTVASELLGTGDATQINQEFVLQKSPLTYLPAGEGYKSTLAVYVNGLQWTEAASFYQQPASARVFITWEDDQRKTHVQFGDWINGAGLASGAQVTVAYRIESGLDAPAAGALTTIAKPFPGLRAIRNPIAAGGGADPDPASQIRTYAPRSVLTFGRAISADDYEAIASAAPSVNRVRAAYAWNAQEQRATVSLYVGDTAAAVAAARSALTVAADPSRPVSVLAANPVYAAMFLAFRAQPDRILEDIISSLTSVLTDATTGLFGQLRTGIGESFYFSQISLAAQRVPGVDAVTAALFLLSRPDPQTGFYLGLPPRVNIGLGEFFVVLPQVLFLFPEVLTSV